VAAWDPNAETTHPVDFRLVHNLFVTMYWRSSLLDEMIEWLRSHGYDVVEFDAASWALAAQMFDDVATGRAQAAVWPGHGKNGSVPQTRRWNCAPAGVARSGSCLAASWARPRC
jgi:hypothetical protein